MSKTGKISVRRPHIDKNLSESKGVRRKIHSILEKLDGVPPTPSPRVRPKSVERDKRFPPDEKPVASRPRRNGQGQAFPLTDGNPNDERRPKINHRLSEIHWTDGQSFGDLLNTIQEGKDCMEALKNVAADRRQDLEQITGELKKAQTEITSLFHRALNRLNELKKHLRTLTAFAEDLSRLGRQRDESAETALKRLKVIDEYRRRTLDSIIDPRWEIKCHFHLFSLEHWRGNTQPSLLDIAEVLPGRLHLVCMAKCLHLNQEDNHAKFRILNKERELLRTKLTDVKKHCVLTQGALKDYKQMLDVMKKSMSPKQLAEVEPALHEVKEVPSSRPARTRFGPGLRGGSRGQRGGHRGGGNFRQQLFHRTGIIQTQKQKQLDIDEIFAAVNSALGLTGLESDDTETAVVVNTDYVSPLQDAPHRDWQTLADILNTVRNATSRRKEVWNQLEDVIKCREGLKTDLHLLRDAYGNSINAVAEAI